MKRVTWAWPLNARDIEVEMVVLGVRWWEILWIGLDQERRSKTHRIGRPGWRKVVKLQSPVGLLLLTPKRVLIGTYLEGND